MPSRSLSTADADKTAVGYVPKADAIDISGLKGVAENMPELLKINKSDWAAEVELIAEHYAKFGDRLPAEMGKQFNSLIDRLNKA